MNIATICPDCLAEIPEESVSADFRWGVCRRCQGLFPLTEELAIPVIPPKPGKPGKVHLKIERCGDSLVVEVPPVKGKLGWLMLVCLVLFTFMMIASPLVFIIGSDEFEGRALPAALFFGSFWLCWVFLGLYYTLYLFFFHRTFRFDPERLEIESRLFFLRFRKTIPRSCVWGIRSDYAPVQYVGNVYTLRLAYKKTAIEIQCRSLEEQNWATSEMNDYLDAASPQRLRCPECHRSVWDEERPEIRCTWCQAVFAREKGTEIDTFYQSEYDLLPPIESRVRIEQTESELTLIAARNGVQTFWHRFGIGLTLLSGAGMLVCLALMFFTMAEGLWICGHLALLFGLSFFLSGWLTLESICHDFLLRITPDHVHAEGRVPPWSRQVMSQPRSPEATARETRPHDNRATDFRTQSMGKYRFTLFNGEHRIHFMSPFAEEVRWMVNLVNRFLHRTSNRRLVVRPGCPVCRVVPPLEQWKPADGMDFQCKNCGKEFSLSGIIKQWEPDPLTPPLTTKIQVEKSDYEFIIRQPAQVDYGASPRVRFLTRLFFNGFFLLLAAFGIFMAYKALLNVPIFFQAFGFFHALLLVTFLVGASCGGAFAYFVLFWMSANMYFYSWTLRIEPRQIVLERCSYFHRWSARYEKPAELQIVFVPRKDFNFHWRRWFSIHYWLDSDPVWNHSHLLLTTDPPIRFPVVEKEEKEWLIATLEEGLKK